MQNLYIQDKWTIKRLTLNLGIRFETENIPTFHREVRDNGFSFGWTDKIAPRLGATYDLLGNGKVKLYGSWGRYFGLVPNSLARGAFGADYWHVYYRALDTPDAFSLSPLIPNVAASNGTNLPGKNLWSDVTGSSRDRRVLDFDTVAPGIKPMSTDQINVGAEFQLNSTTVFRAGFIRNSLNRTIEDQGALVNGDEVYFYGNPGEGATAQTPTSGATKPFPTPKPKRNYNAMELSITRRFATRWLGSASYVLAGCTEIIRVFPTPMKSAARPWASPMATRRIRPEPWFATAMRLRALGIWTRSCSTPRATRASTACCQPIARTSSNCMAPIPSSGERKWAPTSTAAAERRSAPMPGPSIRIPIFVNGRGDMGRTDPLTRRTW